MGSTYLKLTNKLLRRINEPPLTESVFESARNIHSTAKEAIADTVQRINSDVLEWPFNAAEHTQTLTIGTQEYAWPSNWRSIDWNSFYILKNDSLNTKTNKLCKISRDEWYYKYRERDYDAGSDGLRIPEFVFEAHGNGWGVTPSPDKEYEIKFRYFLSPDELTNYDDVTTIPSEYDYVIIAGALYIMKIFKDNSETGDRAGRDYQNGLQKMRSTLVNNYEYVTSTFTEQTQLTPGYYYDA